MAEQVTETNLLSAAKEMCLYVKGFCYITQSKLLLAGMCITKNHRTGSYFVLSNSWAAVRGLLLLYVWRSVCCLLTWCSLLPCSWLGGSFTHGLRVCTSVLVLAIDTWARESKLDSDCAVSDGVVRHCWVLSKAFSALVGWAQLPHGHWIPLHAVHI